MARQTQDGTYTVPYSGPDIDPLTGKPKTAAPNQPTAGTTTQPWSEQNPWSTTQPVYQTETDPSRTTTTPAPAPTLPTKPAMAPAPELAGWESVRAGDFNKAWVDFIQMKYGQAAAGPGFANLPPGGLAQAVADFNAATGAHATVSGDTVNFGNGQSIDALTNSKGGGPQYLWSSAGGGPQGQPGYGGSSGAPGGVAGGGGGGGLGVGSIGGGGGLQNAFIAALMKRLQEDPTVDPNDPNVKGQTDAYRAEQIRAERNYEKQLAEQGGPNANISAEKRMGAEKLGSNVSAFEAQAMQTELAARRQEIQNALSGAAGYITAEQAMALQQELAQLDLQQRAYEYDTTRSDNLFG